MSARDVSDTLDDGLCFAGPDQVKVRHQPSLRSNNGPSYVAAELNTYLNGQDMAHTRGRPYHPMTQRKIDRWPRSMKTSCYRNTITCPATWNDVSVSSSNVITMRVITKH
jgi:putative transposase